MTGGLAVSRTLRRDAVGLIRVLTLRLPANLALTRAVLIIRMLRTRLATNEALVLGALASLTTLALAFRCRIHGSCKFGKGGGELLLQIIL